MPTRNEQEESLTSEEEQDKFVEVNLDSRKNSIVGENDQNLGEEPTEPGFLEKFYQTLQETWKTRIMNILQASGSLMGTVYMEKFGLWTRTAEFARMPEPILLICDSILKDYYNLNHATMGMKTKIANRVMSVFNTVIGNVAGAVQTYFYNKGPQYDLTQLSAIKNIFFNQISGYFTTAQVIDLVNIGIDYLCPTNNDDPMLKQAFDKVRKLAPPVLAIVGFSILTYQQIDLLGIENAKDIIGLGIVPAALPAILGVGKELYTTTQNLITAYSIHQAGNDLEANSSINSEPSEHTALLNDQDWVPSYETVTAQTPASLGDDSAIVEITDEDVLLTIGSDRNPDSLSSTAELKAKKTNNQKRKQEVHDQLTQIQVDSLEVSLENFPNHR
ncbi:hypothetical protein P344_04140 [Spiroplasma mirum ATCC 29335]|uniref:Uncharacterized protein n=1 Tax=Spiroplasma mirum ATCC 29335 TaxID=838561 RepID=W0GPW1_9MOLU|nr:MULTISPECIES: hypothetical protein [Spiroplasma]AHF61108.1 hypothetical protein SMM_0690 [Spiroplasma mirum ATCC 29335]AHI58156.1 hypothetical protein P344_04140 [Spiroplasma mirum ATCC 29335]AKM53206.1 hypothetical protein SATRI_v1c07540 [Spiroplasma atrichopogonis]